MAMTQEAANELRQAKLRMQKNAQAARDAAINRALLAEINRPTRSAGLGVMFHVVVELTLAVLLIAALVGWL